MTRRKHELELELERSQRELREARERLSGSEASIADMCRGREHLTRQLGVLRAERDEARAEGERLRVEGARLEAATKSALEVAMSRARLDTVNALVRQAEERGARWALSAAHAACCAEVNATREERDEGGEVAARGCANEISRMDAARICEDGRKR